MSSDTDRVFRRILENGPRGRWELSFRPVPASETGFEKQSVSFRKPVTGIPQSFAIQIWSLRLLAGSQEWRDSMTGTPIDLTRESAQEALDWVESIPRRSTS